MTIGRLGASDLAQATNTTVFQVTTSKVASFTVNICNRNTTSVKIRIALAATATPSAGEYIEYDSVVSGNSVLNLSGLVLDSQKYVVAYSDTANVSVVAYGYEE